MRLKHDRICTWNSEVEAGKSYLYTEGTLECKVKVLQASQHKEGIQLNLKVIAKPHTSPVIVGEEFEVGASWNHPDKNQWWSLHDQDLAYF